MRRWKISVVAIVIIALAIGLMYGYAMFLQPKLAARARLRQAGKPGLIQRLAGEDYFAELGNLNAPTKVVAYVPTIDCQDDVIQVLMEEAKKWPDDLHVRFFKINSSQVMQMLEQQGKDICCRYEIDGQDTFDLPQSDGSTRKVVFHQAPGAGGWTADELKTAVEQAIAKAKQSPLGAGATPVAQGREPALILELTGENYFAEFGNPDAPTKAVAYLPDDSCHNEPIKLLVEKAKQSRNALYVKLIRMYSAEGMQALKSEKKEVCACYEINGQDTFDVPRPDGSTAQVCFRKSPGAGGWTPDQLRTVIEGAIAKAK